LRFFKDKLKLQLIFWGIIIILFVQLLNAITMISLKKTELADDIYRNANAYTKLTTNKVIEYYLHYHNSGYFMLYNLLDETMTLNEDIEKIYIYRVDGYIVLHPNDIRDRKKPTKIKIKEDSGICNRIHSTETSQSFYKENKKSKIDIISPYIDDQGRHSYCVRYIFNYNKLDQKISHMINNIVIISFISILIAIILFIIFAQKMNSRITGLIREKELLLKETYHRVKNNFQTIVSLLYIESSKDRNRENKDSFIELANRIKSMSLIHNYLLESQEFSIISSDDYMQNIIQEIKRGDIDIQSSIDPYDLSSDQALALGVITNEVLSNSIKYHPHIEKCEIQVAFEVSEGSATLTIQDNGLGFDANTPATTDGFGLKMVEEFASHLKSSSVKCISNRGTLFILRFTL